MKEVERQFRGTEMKAVKLAPHILITSGTRTYDSDLPHVLGAGGDKVCRFSFDLGVSDKRSKGREKQGRLDTIDDDLKLAGIDRGRAHYRAKWRRRITDADAVTKREKH
ncbi:hypothetical protein ANCDUO_05491 [Ancylostoma duodenale]|uniref:Uncharacterized protein n=1 Tax=Ancylostoma duodenale TaxID=51022 RepID=A0A0C2H460_9BILA|nr:hypothetical protein ANCDUO_05491 [Ancylostoma duodenale]